MITKTQIGNLTWIDLESPSKEELRDVMDNFDIDPITLHDLLEPTLKAHTENFGDYLYLVLHFPSIRDNKMLSDQEIDFVLGTDFLITTRYQAISAMEDLRKSIETHIYTNNIDKDQQLKPVSDAELVYSYGADIFLEVINKMYSIVEQQIEEVEDDLEDIEEQIFREKEREMVFALSYAGRDILNIRQALDPHQDTLKSLADFIEQFSSHHQKLKLLSVENTYFRLRKKTNQLWQSLNELRETNNSLLTTKQNEVMKIFTILAFVTFPLSLVSSIFGMNTEYIPITGLHLDLGFIVIPDFWIVIFLMFLATLLMFAYFKKKNWI